MRIKNYLFIHCKNTDFSRISNENLYDLSSVNFYCLNIEKYDKLKLNKINLKINSCSIPKFLQVFVQILSSHQVGFLQSKAFYDSQ